MNILIKAPAGIISNKSFKYFIFVGQYYHFSKNTYEFKKLFDDLQISDALTDSIVL